MKSDVDGVRMLWRMVGYEFEDGKYVLGRLELKHPLKDYKWGALCSHYIGQQEVDVFCKELGFSKFEVVESNESMSLSN